MSVDHARCGRAMEALEEGYRAVFAAAREGTTAEEVDAVLRNALAVHGIELRQSRISPYVVGPEGAPPKLRINRVPLQRGSLWGMDFSVCADAFWADLGRYGFIGKPTAEILAAYRSVLNRQDALAAQVRAGRAVDEIVRACPDDMPYEIHRIGQQPTMFPVCGNASPAVLESTEQSRGEGVVFQIGDVVCVEVWAGLSGGIEDMYLMEPGGLARISTLPRDLCIMEAL